MKIKKISISKENLEKTNKDERIFFYGSSWFLAEISTLQKLHHFAMNLEGIEDEYPSPELYARNYQTAFLGCLLSSKLWEGWVLLKKDYFLKKLDQKYQKQYSEEAKESLKYLKKYFGRENIINKIRNSTFHYPVGEDETEYFENLLSNEPKDYETQYFIGESFGQSLFPIDRFLANFSSKIGKDGIEKSADTLYKESKEIIKHFMWFLSDYIYIFQKECGFNEEIVEVNGVVNGKDIKIPFFFKTK